MGTVLAWAVLITAVLTRAAQTWPVLTWAGPGNALRPGGRCAW